MTRIDFQRLAEERLDDAQALLDAKRFGCAYYVAGYAVECATKACIAKLTRQDDFPPKEAGRYYTHDLNALIGYAGLRDELNRVTGSDPEFAQHWRVALDWKEEVRYQFQPQLLAEQLLIAIREPNHGVLQWLKRYW